MKKISFALCLLATLISNTILAQSPNISLGNWRNYEVFNNSEHFDMKIEYTYASDNYDCRGWTQEAFISNAKTENHSIILKRACAITKVSAIDENGQVKFTIEYPEPNGAFPNQKACEPNISVDTTGNLTNAIMLDDMHGSNTIACVAILTGKKSNISEY